MSSKPQTVQRENAATPLSQDIIQLLQGQIAEGAFGTGVGPLQREAGTAIRQFVSSGGMDLPDELERSMTQRQTNQRNVALADLGEQFGAAGAQAGSSLALGSSDLLSRLVPRQTEQFFQERRRFNDQRLRSIAQMAQMGQQNIAPFLSMAGQGLFAPEVFQQESPWVTAAGVLSGLAQGGGRLASGLGSMGGGGGAPA